MIATLRRLARDVRGLAMLEFGLVAPVLLMLVLGGLELAHYAMAHMRVNQIAMTVADNAGRVPTGVDEANIYEVFAGAQVMGDSIDFKKHGRIVLSSLQDNELKDSDSGQMINWQRCYGDLKVDPSYGKEGKGKTDASLKDGMGPTGRKIISAKGTAVMVVEVSYDYQPLIDSGYMMVNKSIRHETAFNVRGRTNNDITNTQDLVKNACS